MPISWELKKQLLSALHEAYDEAATGFASACTRQCSVCCTHNVVATTLEADLVLDRLEATGRTDLILAMEEAPLPRRLRPALSINALAAYCLRRQDPPIEESEIDSSPCPLRGEEGCVCYHVRPLGCRILWSEELCSSDGEAVMRPLLVTINGVFQQIAEHVDSGGLYGNLSDLVLALRQPAVRTPYRSGLALEPMPYLHRNEPSPGFLVPPEHRQAVSRVLGQLWEKRVDDRSFRQTMLDPNPE